MVAIASPPVPRHSPESFDAVLLLLAHLICADQQIHLKEDQSLRAFLEATEIDEGVRSQIAGIFGQDPAALEQTPTQLALRIPKPQRLEVFQQLLLVAHADGYFAPEEQHWVEQLAIDWGLSKQAASFMAEAEEMVTEQAQGSSSRPGLSEALREQLSAGARSLLLQLKTQPETIERDLLLAGPEYQAAINRCKQVAQEDFAWSEPILDEAQEVLKQLDKDIAPILTKFEDELAVLSSANKKAGIDPSKDAKRLREAIKQIQATKAHLHEKILAELDQFQAARQAKQRSLKHFTIAFMGKTKAGKSTLHSVLTNGTWNDIGVGKQRTTRYNRVYELDNGLRIVDTPGIGAPGGKTDTETAQSIVDEADVICFVVTDDSIQESEFEFLKLLRGQAKPVIILLNIKQNLRDERRLRKFLENPNQPFSKEGKDSIQGHISRIKRYAQEHYPNGYVEIVPVMLLAAQLSQEEKYQGQSDALYQASRVQSFLDQLRVSIVEHGAMRRSQTLLGSTAIKLAKPQVWMRQEAQQYRESSQALADSLNELKHALTKAHTDAQEMLESGLKKVFQDLKTEAESFAEDNWECEPSLLSSKWGAHVKRSKFDERLQGVYKQADQLFEKRITRAIDEIGVSLKFDFKLNLKLSNFKTEMSELGKEHLGWTSAALSVAAGAAFFVFPPLFIPLSALSGLIGVLSSFFKGRDDRRRENSRKISREICQALKEQASGIQAQAKEALQQQKSSVDKQISHYFEQQIYGQKSLLACFEKAEKGLDLPVAKLNKAYAFRILCWAAIQEIFLTAQSIERFVNAVERTSGKSITIRTIDTVGWARVQRDRPEMSRVLQEEVTIIQN